LGTRVQDLGVGASLRGGYQLGEVPGTGRAGLRGYLAHKKLPQPWDDRRALGIGLL